MMGVLRKTKLLTLFALLIITLCVVVMGKHTVIYVKQREMVLYHGKKVSVNTFFGHIIKKNILLNFEKIIFQLPFHTTFHTQVKWYEYQNFWPHCKQQF